MSRQICELDQFSGKSISTRPQTPKIGQLWGQVF